MSIFGPPPPPRRSTGLPPPPPPPPSGGPPPPPPPSSGTVMLVSKIDQNRWSKIVNGVLRTNPHIHSDQMDDLLHFEHRTLPHAIMYDPLLHEECKADLRLFGSARRLIIPAKYLGTFLGRGPTEWQYWANESIKVLQLGNDDGLIVADYGQPVKVDFNNFMKEISSSENFPSHQMQSFLAFATKIECIQAFCFDEAWVQLLSGLKDLVRKNQRRKLRAFTVVGTRATGSGFPGSGLRAAISLNDVQKLSLAGEGAIEKLVVQGDLRPLNPEEIMKILTNASGEDGEEEGAVSEGERDEQQGARSDDGGTVVSCCTPVEVQLSSKAADVPLNHSVAHLEKSGLLFSSEQGLEDKQGDDKESSSAVAANAAAAAEGEEPTTAATILPEIVNCNEETHQPDLVYFPVGTDDEYVTCPLDICFRQSNLIVGLFEGDINSSSSPHESSSSTSAFKEVLLDTTVPPSTLAIQLAVQFMMTCPEEDRRGVVQFMAKRSRGHTPYPPSFYRFTNEVLRPVVKSQVRQQSRCCSTSVRKRPADASSTSATSRMSVTSATSNELFLLAEMLEVAVFLDIPILKIYISSTLVEGLASDPHYHQLEETICLQGWFPPVVAPRLDAPKRQDPTPSSASTQNSFSDLLSALNSASAAPMKKLPPPPPPLARKLPPPKPKRAVAFDDSDSDDDFAPPAPPPKIIRGGRSSLFESDSSSDGDRPSVYYRTAGGERADEYFDDEESDCDCPPRRPGAKMAPPPKKRAVVSMFGSDSDD